MRDRPYMNSGGSQLLQIYRSHSDDLEVVCDIAYELQFRDYIQKEDKAEVVGMTP